MTGMSPNPVMTRRPTCRPGPARPDPARSGQVSAKRLRGVAQEFVGFFMGEMFKSMGQGLKTEGYGLGGTTESIWREMAHEEYGKEAAQAPDNDLTELVYRSFARRASLQTER